MTDCCKISSCEIENLQARQSKTLKGVLFINGGMFLIEFVAGLIADSTALLADSLDMLGDTLVYVFSMYVVSRNDAWKAVSGLIKAGIMSLFGLFVLGQASYKYFNPITPQFETIGLIGMLAIALALIAAQGNPLGIKGPKDLAGHKVGVEIAGFEEKKLRKMNDEQVKAGLKTMDIRVFNTYGETFLALGAGQVDAVFAGDAIGTYYQQQGKFTKAATGLLPGTPGTMATVNITLAKAVTAAMQAMYEDGTYAKMMDAYGTTKLDAWKQWKGKFQYHFNP